MTLPAIPVPEMVEIPTGCFLMGSPADEPERRHDHERQHRVCVDAFAIVRYEVTFDEYDAFAQATGRELPGDQGWGRGRHPVINVSWHDATAYAAWLREQTGLPYRMPTEAEWEYAARAGTTTPFWSGDCINTDQANYAGTVDYNGCGAKAGVYRVEVLPGGSLAANPWGLYDISVKVSEWTCSVFDADYGGAEQRCAGEPQQACIACSAAATDSTTRAPCAPRTAAAASPATATWTPACVSPEVPSPRSPAGRSGPAGRCPLDTDPDHEQRAQRSGGGQVANHPSRARRIPVGLGRDEMTHGQRIARRWLASGGSESRV